MEFNFEAVFESARRGNLEEEPEAEEGVYFDGMDKSCPVIPADATKIGRWAFCGNTVLERIEIPEGVTEIGDKAFYGCTSLETVVIPHTLRSIGFEAFRGCTSLRNINLPDGVRIAAGAFNGCTNLNK